MKGGDNEKMVKVYVAKTLLRSLELDDVVKSESVATLDTRRNPPTCIEYLPAEYMGTLASLNCYLIGITLLNGQRKLLLTERENVLVPEKGALLVP